MGIQGIVYGFRHFQPNFFSAWQQCESPVFHCFVAYDPGFAGRDKRDDCQGFVYAAIADKFGDSGAQIHFKGIAANKCAIEVNYRDRRFNHASIDHGKRISVRLLYNV